MSEYNTNPQSDAERLICEMFAQREAAADPQIARLHFENRLGSLKRTRVRAGLKIAAFFSALLLLGGWATNLQLPAWDDGQQITIKLPDSFSPSQYPHWVAVVVNHSGELGAYGGHSLVVDYREGKDGKFYLVLGLIGVDYARANEWIRGVMARVPDLRGTPYGITQPMLPYRITVGDMLAFRLGSNEAVERNVLRAWKAIGETPSDRRGFLYLIARPTDYAKRVSLVDY